jgi:hypothetical protein
MDASELRDRARQEADELGPERPGTEQNYARRTLGAVELLAGLADDDAERLRRAANGVSTDVEARAPLLDAAADAAHQSLEGQDTERLGEHRERPATSERCFYAPRRISVGGRPL